MVAVCRSAPDPAHWIKQPLLPVWQADPLILDCCFQMVTLWCLTTDGQAALPVSAGLFRRFQQVFPRDGAEIVLNITGRAGPGVKTDIEIFDLRGALLARFTELTAVMADSLKPAFLRNSLNPLPYSGTTDNSAPA